MISTNTFNFPGARWWKCDFHPHTPASLDYGKGPRQAEMIAQRYHRIGGGGNHV